ncbi:nucleotide exchange factor SIL1 [Anoplophora glabripennis]|uniref:nucleotide exchange factor SIL1 n=1 Tax=Anoplophora glabripennis TaxID=217634 RepID=UPI0008749E71|nr:nucleotide exchange factor SIL1 [Anoplophora glabripennis]
MLIKTLWILICVLEITSQKNQDKEDVFVPTREWQVVKKGQSIPKGLHIRVNFETGVTEAKLLDRDDEVSRNNALLEVPQEKKDDEEFLKPENIKETLKKIKADDILKVDEIKDVKGKFRSYEDLKKEMNSLNLTPKIDAEILTDLFKQFEDEMEREKINIYTIIRILEDLDFLAHQFDNALEFVRQNGFKEIIYKNLNSSDSQIKQETLKLFGSLVQNNGKVQIHALETGSIGILLRILHLESVDVKSRAIYALSCLLRRFPLAQLRFVENGGISVVTEILEKDPVIKVQIKLITLMNDLLIENIQALKDNSNENQNFLISQYQRINLENLLLSHGWCEYLNKLLYSLIAADPDDHDSIEKCVLAMHTVTNKCVQQYSGDVLMRLQERYRSLALNDLDRSDELSNSDFFTNLHDLCGDMVQQKNIKTEL